MQLGMQDLSWKLTTTGTNVSQTDANAGSIIREICEGCGVHPAGCIKQRLAWKSSLVWAGLTKASTQSASGGPCLP